MANEEAQTPKEGSAPVELTVEELTTKHEAELKDRDGRISGLNKSNTRLQKELTVARKSSTDNEARFKGVEDSLATLRDSLAGQEGNEATAVKELTEQRRKASEVSAADPQETRFMEDLAEEGLKVDWDALDDPELTDPIVNEALKTSKSPLEARTALSKALRAQREIANRDLITVGIQQGLKDAGVTTKGAGAPSVAIQDDDAFMLDYSAGKTDDHKRATEILAKNN